MIKKRKSKIALVLAVFALFFCLHSAKLEAAKCEEAFFRCINDPFVGTNLAGPLYCGVGYVFCKKYIE